MTPTEGLTESDILDEGFQPLRKTLTFSTDGPETLSKGKSAITRGISFQGESEESPQALWEGSAWNKLEKSRGKMMERATSFIGTRGRSATQAARDAIVIVDPFSTGAHLAAAVCAAGYQCVRVFSIWDSPVAALVQEGLTIDFCATIQHNDRLPNEDAATNDTVAMIRGLPFNVLAVIPGAETGVELADRLSHRLELRSNGEAQSLARRNKYMMGEAVRQSGTRAVLQQACTSMEEVHTFLASIPQDPFRCVVKPVQSAGTDDVFLCSTISEAETAFTRILGKRNGLGLINESVLVQEFLVGKEYVIDKVSRDGVHKLVCIWEYDKRAVNGANFVYYGMRVMSCETKKAKEMVEYADKVLDALGIMQGPSHMEIMYNDTTGPCLVEVGSRCHGGEGTWLPTLQECIGYTQVSVTLDCYLDGKFFHAMDKDHYVLTKAGREVDMLTEQSGVVRTTPGDAFIRQLSSFRSLSWEIKPGDYAAKTIDCFTRPGCVQLVSDTEEQADLDFEAVHSMDKCGLIDFSVICPTPPVTGAVVIVDPFSTGANLAAMVIKMGFKLILVFSENDNPVAALVSKEGAGNMVPTLLIQHDNMHKNQDQAIKDTMDKLLEQGAPVLAILPGAETGVELAERMAARYGTRNNGEEMTHARRNKFDMQEVVRNAGLRAVQQKLCRSADDVDVFVGELSTVQSSGGFKCVVKPNESAGTDSVFLCTSPEEVLTAFNVIHGKENGLGHQNDGALCQEFLTGTEFVIDGVSRDGVYKVTCIWEYDKRSVNGANFVYYGMFLRGGEGEREKALIAYAQQVVKSLGILHGPSHMEVMYDPVSGPCLVEVGSRCHGGEGTWLPVVEECIGYSQLDATLSCYIRPDRFEALPFFPTPLKQGCEAFLVSHESGVLRDIPGLEEIRNFQSFRRMELMTQPGAVLAPTIDCFTRPGSVQMVSSTKDGLMADYTRIRELEKEGLFDLLP
eukprot:CAMPEP_0119051766 /NCGR_PEP_ID=MMETSP1177-20130426/73276_1 /TAXON_ID=2985 /ORGANISM="Ochromonas sp, Strain CCMP1899" /LENGTH=963 /DNA_ID=CAMNT_0007031083 /DNA_START=116 /DNA_END=3007 /DNA_ORIENTATION=-